MSHYQTLVAAHRNEVQRIESQLYQLNQRRQELLSILATFDAVDREQAKDVAAVRTDAPPGAESNKPAAPPPGPKARR
jgi:hypothetical protein